MYVFVCIPFLHFIFFELLAFFGIFLFKRSMNDGFEVKPDQICQKLNWLLKEIDVLFCKSSPLQLHWNGSFRRKGVKLPVNAAAAQSFSLTEKWKMFPEFMITHCTVVRVLNKGSEIHKMCYSFSFPLRKVQIFLLKWIKIFKKSTVLSQTKIVPFSERKLEKFFWIHHHSLYSD